MVSRLPARGKRGHRCGQCAHRGGAWTLLLVSLSSTALFSSGRAVRAAAPAAASPNSHSLSQEDVGIGGGDDGAVGRDDGTVGRDDGWGRAPPGAGRRPSSSWSPSPRRPRHPMVAAERSAEAGFVEEGVMKEPTEQEAAAEAEIAKGEEEEEGEGDKQALVLREMDEKLRFVCEEWGQLFFRLSEGLCLPHSFPALGPHLRALATFFCGDAIPQKVASPRPLQPTSSKPFSWNEVTSPKGCSWHGATKLLQISAMICDPHLLSCLLQVDGAALSRPETKDEIEAVQKLFGSDEASEAAVAFAAWYARSEKGSAQWQLCSDEDPKEVSPSARLFLAANLRIAEKHVLPQLRKETKSWHKFFWSGSDATTPIGVVMAKEKFLSPGSISQPVRSLVYGLSQSGL